MLRTDQKLLTVISQRIQCGTRTSTVSLFWGNKFRPFPSKPRMPFWCHLSLWLGGSDRVDDSQAKIPQRNPKRGHGCLRMVVRNEWGRGFKSKQALFISSINVKQEYLASHQMSQPQRTSEKNGHTRQVLALHWHYIVTLCQLPRFSQTIAPKCGWFSKLVKKPSIPVFLTIYRNPISALTL